MLSLWKCVLSHVPSHNDHAALTPPRQPLLVILRGESFRVNVNASLFHANELECSHTSISALEESSATHMTLLRILATSFDIELHLHSYDVPGCSLNEHYAPAAVWPTQVYFYDHDVMRSLASSLSQPTTTHGQSLSHLTQSGDTVHRLRAIG